MSAAATLGVLWLVAWPAAPARADAAREQCVAAHVQGQELKLGGDYAGARASFAACSAARCPAVVREDCASLLAGLDAELPTVVLTVHTTDGRPVPDARVFVDGQLVSESTDGRALPLTPGAHQLRVEAAGRQPSLSQLDVARADRARVVHIALASAVPPVVPTSAPAPHARGRSLLPVYVLGGSTLAVLATGAVLGGLGKREHSRLDDEGCGERACTDDDTRKGRRLYIAADVMFGAGAALGVAAVSLYFARYFGRNEASHALAPLDASVGTHGATLRYRASF